MTFKRLLVPACLLAFPILTAPATAQDSGGGAAASPVATPAEPAAVTPAPSPVPAEAVPPAVATQDETPTTPEGEEQPPEEQPDGEQAPTEENGESFGGGQGGAGGGGEEATGGLPQTGSEVAALTSIGLGLLLAGAALLPTSSWPPPRDRLSRSTQRR